MDTGLVNPVCRPVPLLQLPPVSLQVNLALGSHILLVPSQSFSSPPSSQSLSPSHLQRSGMQVPSVTQWNSSAPHSITDGSTETKARHEWSPCRSAMTRQGKRCGCLASPHLQKTKNAMAGLVPGYLWRKDVFKINEFGLLGRNKNTKDCETRE